MTDDILHDVNNLTGTSEENNPDNVTKDELLSVMEQFGHTLHHKKGGKHGQKRILRILYTDSPMTQRELQEKLKIQAGSMSEIITKLENNGFVQKTKDEHDKRKAVLIITDKGRETVRNDLDSAVQNNRRLLEPLSGEEQALLLNLLKKLLSAWKIEDERREFEKHNM